MPSFLLMKSWSLKNNSLDVRVVISQQFLVGLDLCLVGLVVSGKLVYQLLARGSPFIFFSVIFFTIFILQQLQSVEFITQFFFP